MIQNKKRIISLILMLTLLVSALVVGAVTASAAGGTWTLVTDAGELAAGDKVVIVAKDYDYAMSTTQNSNNRGQAAVSKSGNSLTFTSSVQEFTLEEGAIDGSFAFNAGDAGYICAASSGSNYLRTKTSKDANASWKIEISNGNTTITAQGSYTRKVMQYNQSSSLFACYSSASQKAICIYKFVANTTSCEHTNKVAIGEANDATCTEAGITAGEKCSTCGETITAQEEIPALGHNYVDGVCSACGAVKPETPSEATISFANTTHRVSQDTKSQVWANDDLTFTNDKADSRDNVADYSNPVRLYKNSTITIEFSGMTKIEFVCSSESYATDLASSITDKTVNCVKNGTNVTLTFSEAMDKYTITLSSGQVRLYTITASAVEITCKHNNVTTTTVEATCTKDGSTTETCKDCGETVSTRVIEKLGHSYNDGEITTKPTCTEQGKKTYTCSVCNNKKTEAVVANGHKYVDGVCSACGEKEINYSGRFFIAAIRTSGNYFYMTSDLGAADTKRYQVVNSGLKDLTEAVCPKDGFIFVLVKNGDGTYKIYAEGVEGDNYLGWTSGNSGTLVAEEKAIKFTVDLLESGLYNIHFAASDAERYLALNGTTGNDYFAFYKSGQKQNLSLVPVGHDHEACPHKAVVGETYYETIEQAIAGATAGTTIKLNANVKVTGDVVVTNNVIIDLNGKELKVSGDLITFHSTTRIIGDGKLVIDKEGLLDMTGATEYVPVWHTEGYYTFEQIDSQVKDGGEAGNETVIFRPAFVDGSHVGIFGDVDEDYVEGESTEYNGGAADNGISFVISITWGTGENAVSKQYTLSNTLIAEIYSQKKAIQLGFKNWQADVEYTVTLRIVSGGLYYETDLCTMVNGDVVAKTVTE